MKKAILSLIGSVGFLAVALPAIADTAQTPITIDTCPHSSAFGSLCLGAGDIGKVITNSINFLFVVAALMALVFLVIGGVKWLTSQGEKEGIGKARETIVAAVVGLIIIFLSYLIVNFILNLFVGVSLFNLRLPTITGSQ